MPADHAARRAGGGLSADAFPVVWDDPADAGVTWSFARLHYPHPVTLLTHELRILSQDTGMLRADAVIERPAQRLSRRINTYHYRGVRPLPLPPEELAARRRRSEERLVSLARRIGDVWRGHLPEIETILAAADRAPVERLDAAGLADELALMISRSGRLWEIHFLVMPSVLVSMELFGQTYCELFPDRSRLDALRLLQGVDTKTVEAARGIWALARAAEDDARVRRLLSAGTPPTLAALEPEPAAATFLERFADYLDRYGRRGVTMDPSLPSVGERPDEVLAEVWRTVEGGRDPEAQLAAVRAERDAAVADALAELAGHPRPVVNEFRVLLAAAQDGVMVQETHNFYIDFGFAQRSRRVILGIAACLERAGVIAERDDVFHLGLEELREALAGRPHPDLAERIAARRAELEHFGGIEPPAELGAPAPPPGQGLIERAGAGFAGAPPPPSEPGLVRGHPGSAGLARGIARVAHTPDEAVAIAPGEILVTEMTGAPWTPLFARIAALVTDAGGALSHSAIVAREYGIPAVVGTGRATTTIPDGALIDVDGEGGTVRIVTGS